MVAWAYAQRQASYLLIFIILNINHRVHRELRALSIKREIMDIKDRLSNVEIAVLNI